MAKQSAANIALMARLDEIEAQVKQIAMTTGADFQDQSLTFDDVRHTIHNIAEQIATIADAIPAIAATLEQMARWIAVVTEADPIGPGPTEPPKTAARKK